MLRTLIQKFKQSDYAKNVAKLATGSTLAQAISILSAPILYRIYDKTDYGTLALYMTFLAFVAVFSTLQLHQAILIEKDDDDALDVMWAIRAVNMTYTAGLFLVVFFLGDEIAGLLKAPQLEKWLFLAPISIFFSGQKEVLNVWANRKKEYSIIATNNIITALITPALSITIGVFYSGPIGLFAGLIAGHVVPSILLWFRIAKKYTITLKFLKFKEIVKIIKKHRDFPLYQLPTNFLWRIISQVPVLMINNFFGVALVAVYNLSTRMLNLPLSLIGQALRQVFMQRAAEQNNSSGKFSSLFVKSLKSVVVFSIIPFAFIVFAAPSIFAILFGSKWEEAGTLTSILGLSYLVAFWSIPFSSAFIIRNRQRENFIWHLFFLIINASVLFVGFSTFSDYYITFALFSGVNALIYGLFIYRSYQLSLGSKNI